MALLVETNVPLNYLEFLKTYQLKVQKEMEKNLLRFLKSLGEDVQEIKLPCVMDTAFPCNCNDRLCAERVSGLHSRC